MRYSSRAKYLLCLWILGGPWPGNQIWQSGKLIFSVSCYWCSLLGLSLVFEFFSGPADNFLLIKPAQAKTYKFTFFKKIPFLIFFYSTTPEKCKAKNRSKNYFSKVKLWAFEVCYLTRLKLHPENFRRQWGLCALRHGIQISMEAILACHPARSTEWLDCHPKLCELWRIRTGPISSETGPTVTWSVFAWAGSISRVFFFSGFSMKGPLCFHFGHKSPEGNGKLYCRLMDAAAELVDKRCQETTGGWDLVKWNDNYSLSLSLSLSLAHSLALTLSCSPSISPPPPPPSLTHTHSLSLSPSLFLPFSFFCLSTSLSFAVSFVNLLPIPVLTHASFFVPEKHNLHIANHFGTWSCLYC